MLLNLLDERMGSLVEDINKQAYCPPLPTCGPRTGSGAGSPCTSSRRSWPFSGEHQPGQAHTR